MKINIQELDEGFRLERKEEFQQLRVEKPFFLLHDALNAARVGLGLLNASGFE